MKRVQWIKTFSRKTPRLSLRSLQSLRQNSEWNNLLFLLLSKSKYLSTSTRFNQGCDWAERSGSLHLLLGACFHRAEQTQCRGRMNFYQFNAFLKRSSSTLVLFVMKFSFNICRVAFFVCASDALSVEEAWRSESRGWDWKECRWVRLSSHNPLVIVEAQRPVKPDRISLGHVTIHALFADIPSRSSFQSPVKSTISSESSNPRPMTNGGKSSFAAPTDDLIPDDSPSLMQYW